VLWPELGGNVPVLLLEFDSFANTIVPGLTAELFRFVSTFGPVHVIQVGKQVSKGFSLAQSTTKKWGDTKIAERGRSVLVMRARYRSSVDSRQKMG